MKQLMDHQREMARRVAQHEMGHYVAARTMGFETGEVSIELTGFADGHHGTTEITLPEHLPSIDEITSYLERRVIVLYAGGAAETLPGRGAPDQKVDVEEAVKIICSPGAGAEQDHAKAKELIHVLRNIIGENPVSAGMDAVQEELTALDRRLFQRAVELVEKNAAYIVGLAANLADRVTAIRQKQTLSKSYLEGLPAVAAIALDVTQSPDAIDDDRQMSGSSQDEGDGIRSL